MELDFEKGKVQYGLMALIFFLLALYISSLTLDPTVSQGYSQFYFIHQVLAFAAIPVLIVFNWKLGQIIEIPNIYKIGVVITWIVFIVAISTPGVQKMLNYADCTDGVCVSRPIIPIPQAMSSEFAAQDPGKDMITTSVIPAFTEDPNYLFILPMLLMVAGIFVAEFFTEEIPLSILITIAVIACLISASVFTGAHGPAYGNNQGAYTGAFVFAFGQSAVNVFTGWFIPAAHGLHNYIVTASQSASYSIGGHTLI